MNSRILNGGLALLWLLVCLSFVPVIGAAAATPAAPDVLVRSVIDELTDALKTHQQAVVSDPRTVIPLLQQLVVPHVDFDLMGREVLGRYWGQASDAQRTRFLAAFQQLLVDDYAAIFRDYSNQTVKVLPDRSQTAPDRALVSTDLITPGQQPVRVDYRLHRDHGGWRIYDVEVEGVSLLVNYRESFDDQAQREGLDALIASIESKNQAFRLGADVHD